MLDRSAVIKPGWGRALPLASSCLYSWPAGTRKNFHSVRLEKFYILADTQTIFLCRLYTTQQCINIDTSIGSYTEHLGPNAPTVGKLKKNLPLTCNPTAKQLPDQSGIWVAGHNLLPLPDWLVSRGIVMACHLASLFIEKPGGTTWPVA